MEIVNYGNPAIASYVIDAAGNFVAINAEYVLAEIHDALTTNTPAWDLYVNSLRTAGDVRIDGNDIRDSSNAVVISFDGAGDISQLGSNVPAAGDVLTWSGAFNLWVPLAVAGLGLTWAQTLVAGNQADGVDVIVDEGADLIVYSDNVLTEVARIDGVTGDITTIGTVDGVDVSIHAGDGTIHFTMLDEDGFASNSDTQAATQQSIKAYVDAAVGAENEINEMNDVVLAGPLTNDILVYMAIDGSWHDWNPAEYFAVCDLNDLGTKNHNNLNGIGANDHHAQSHALTTHSDVSLAAPEADRIVFWDHSDTTFEFLVANTGLSITGNNLDCTITQYTDAMVEAVITAELVNGQSIDLAIDSLIATHAGIVAAHHARYTDGEVEAVITAELVNGQSIDNAIDSLISTHNAADTHVAHSGVSISAGTGLTGGGDITASRTLSLSFLGLESLADPNVDCVMFWDESANALKWLIVSTGLNITDVTLTCTITQYTDAMVEAVITAELVNGQSIDLAIDSLIATHAGIVAAHHAKYTDGEALAQAATLISDVAYGVGWDTDATHAPSKNAVYDIISTLSSPVEDDVYGIGWSGDATHAPSQNAVYNYVSTLALDSAVLKKDGTVALTANWDVGAFIITALRFISDVATGTAPYSCTSTTVNTNLNADLIDSVHVNALTDARLLRYESTGTKIENSSVTETAGALGGITTLSMNNTLTNSAAAVATITHSGATGLVIISTSGYVDIENVRFTGHGIIGVSTLTMTDALTFAVALGEITHTGATGLVITSTSGYVQVESVVFNGDTITIGGDVVVSRLAANRLGFASGDSLEFNLGTYINEFSTDVTLAGNSNLAVPTEQAVKTYADAKVSDTAFAATWDGVSTTAPSKNAIYDVIRQRLVAPNSELFIPENGATWATAMGSAVYMPISDNDCDFNFKFIVPETWITGTATFLKVIYTVTVINQIFSGKWYVGSIAIGETVSYNLLNANTSYDFAGSTVVSKMAVNSVALGTDIVAGDTIGGYFQSDASNSTGIMVHGMYLSW